MNRDPYREEPPVTIYRTMDLNFDPNDHTQYEAECEADRRVALGMQFLNGAQPNWRSKIRLDRLNLMSACECVLGFVYDADETPGFVVAVDCQVREHYADRNLPVPVLTGAQSVEYGFDQGYGLCYDELQEAWERVL